MITLFRRIRQKLIDSGSVTKYLLYATGEILLVVIGILIALQVNNWNEERLLQTRMNGYYIEIHEELLENISLSKSYLDANSMLSDKITRSLRLIENAHPDSLEQLKHTIGAVGTAYTAIFSFPVTEEFLSNAYISNVQDDSLKVGLRSLRMNLDQISKVNRYINDQYQSEIEPFFHSNINYSRVVLERNRDEVYIGGPETNFSLLADNMEAWNIINFKLEITNASLRYLSRSATSMEFLARKLEETIEG